MSIWTGNYAKPRSVVAFRDVAMSLFAASFVAAGQKPAAACQQAVQRGAKLEPVQDTRGKQEQFPFLLFDPDHSRIEFKPVPTASK
jgi:hypothetical protein